MYSTPSQNRRPCTMGIDQPPSPRLSQRPLVEITSGSYSADEVVNAGSPEYGDSQVGGDANQLRLQVRSRREPVSCPKPPKPGVGLQSVALSRRCFASFEPLPNAIESEVTE